MRDVNATIEQARRLGSERRFMESEMHEIRNRAIKGYGEFSAFALISDAYNFGFALGYRVGRGEKRKASADAPAK